MSETLVRRWSVLLWLSLGTAAAVVGACSGGSGESRSRPVATGAEAPERGSAQTQSVERAESRGAVASPARAGRDTATANDYSISRLLESHGADVIAFHEHVVTLANPFFEGRSPDTRGNALAAEYIRFYFDQIGLEPPFPGEESPGGSVGSYAFEQPFTVPGDLEVRLAEASWNGRGGGVTLSEGEDFTALGIAGTASTTGKVVFVGYSIEDGESQYSSYNDDDDLTGKIALMLRFEPMDNSGDSRWARFGRWSNAAGLNNKVEAAVKRGAAGVILVNPPGANDPRATRLETVSSTRVGSGLSIPAVMLTPEAADRFVREADPEGRSLMELRILADRGELKGPLALGAGEATFSMATEVERLRLDTVNVGGVLRGRGSLADEWVVIGGHYDHVGYGHVGGARATNIGKLHPGADDNASGTAGIIMLAEMLSARYAAMSEHEVARSVLFLAFSAEEMGLLGADYFVKNAIIPADSVTLMINLDMIGRLQNNELEVSGVGSGKGFMDILRPIFDASGMRVRTSESGVGPSDHAIFYRAGVPVLHFFSGVHPDYHQPADVSYKVNFEGGVRIIRLVEQVALELATRPDKLVHNETQSRQQTGNRARAGVRLGIAPGMYGDDKPGVMVGEVYPNTTASEAGMLSGDRIIRWGGEELADVMGMMERLQNHNPGDKVEIIVERDGNEVTLLLTMRGVEPQG